MFQEEHLTKQFIDELMKIWEKEIYPMTQNKKDKLELIDLLNYDKKTLERFRELSRYSEYNYKVSFIVSKTTYASRKN